VKRGLVISMAPALVLTLSACGVHHDDWARTFGIALCRHEQECGRVSKSVNCARPGYWVQWPEELEAAREGLVRYSPVDARGCLDLLAEVGCIEDIKVRLFQLRECRAAFVGQVEEGAPCALSTVEVCGRELTCAPPDDDQSHRCGRCAAVAKANEAVTYRRVGRVCEVGLYPALDEDLRMGTCQPRPQLGESCSESQPCLELLDCSAREGGTCIRPAPPAPGRGETGEACLTAPRLRPHCAWPAICDEACWRPSVPRIPSSDGGLVGEGCLCVERTSRVGEACNSDSPCEPDALCVYGMCVVPSATEGEPCGPPGCVAGLVCGDNFVCASAFSLCR
jgi:hypothetical protein